MGKGKKKHSKDGRNDDRMKRKDYEAELRKLQVKLCHLQEWIKQKGLRVIIAFEGRDAAGKAAPFAHLPKESVQECSGSLPCPHRPNGKRPSCSFSATSSSFQRPAKS